MTTSRYRTSEIRIPNDRASGKAAARYVVEAARMMGFQDQDLRSIEQGVVSALTALIDYSFEPGEDAGLVIACGPGPDGLNVIVKDKGLPFGAAETSPSGEVCSVEGGSDFCSRIYGLREYFDEIRLRNMGTEGKEVILTKRLKGMPLEALTRAHGPEPSEDASPQFIPLSGKPNWTVRRLSASEAPEVAKLVYRAYGYTYGYPDVYYPERIAALNASGKIHSAVAVAENGEIAGYCALQVQEDNPRIAEIAQAVVDPRYRARGALRAMTAHLIGLAEKEGMYGVFTESVTEHLVSQGVAHRFGFKDCALLLGIVPRNTEFKGLGTLSHRGSLLVQFRTLLRPPGAILYPPSHHREMIMDIYENLGVAPEIKAGPSVATEGNDRSAFRVQAIGSLQLARLVVERAGSDLASRVKTELRGLSRQGFEIVHLHLNLCDPRTSHLAEAFEGLGFFFAGILPGGFPDGDALILQFLDRVTIPYDSIRVESDVAREMLAYINTHDPNQP
ncbi:MAG: GNAT family N-acetyltransferase [Thermodesulfobacteriota bacterium]